MYVPYILNADVEAMTEEELDLASQAAEQFASHRFEMEEF